MTDFKPCQFCAQLCGVVTTDEVWVKSEWHSCSRHAYQVSHCYSYDDNNVNVYGYWFSLQYNDHVWTFSFSTDSLSVFTNYGPKLKYMYNGPTLPITPENALDKLQTMITFS